MTTSFTVLALLAGVAAGEGPAGLDLSVQVAPDLIKEFQAIKHDRYNEAEATRLFKRLRKQSKAYCEMRRNDEEGAEIRDESLAQGYVARGHVKRYVKSCVKCKYDLKAGCWNYLRMNDRRPDLDFELVKELYPSEVGYDCYSVGMTQPYMMHGILGCKSLTMLDFSWRIQDAHLQLLAQFREGGVGDTKTLETAFRAVTVGWVAYRANPRHLHRAKMSTFCNAKEAEHCRDAFMRFQPAFEQLQTVQLALSPLHQMEPLKSDATKVFYMSNALERLYTTPQEADQLLTNIVGALGVGQKAIIIHHVGSFRQFGLYEIERTEEGHEMLGVCRDPYNRTATYDDKPTYGIAYDKRVDPDQRHCRALVREAGIGVKKISKKAKPGGARRAPTAR